MSERKPNAPSTLAQQYAQLETNQDASEPEDTDEARQARQIEEKRALMAEALARHVEKNSDKKPAPETQVTPPELWPLPDFTKDPHARPLTSNENLFGIDFNASKLSDDEIEGLEDVEPMTIEQLEALREEAVAEGKAEGYQAGFAQGEEAGKNQGLLKGHEEGLAQGIEQGLEEAKGQIDALSARWLGLCEKLAQPQLQIDAAVEQQVIDMVMGICREVLNVELKLNQDALLATVKEAVNALPLQQSTTLISLHPDDLSIVEQAFPLATLEQKGWQLLADGSLSRGDCHVQSEYSQVEVSMQQRISQALERFLSLNQDKPQ